MLFVGIDWAETHHAVCVLDERGRILSRRQLSDDMAGVTRLEELLAEHAADPAEVVIGIETDRGLVVRALRATGYTLYAINPLAASRYRERQHLSGSKSDPGDAKVLADLVRTDRHSHRPLAGDSDAVEALQLLTRTHQRLIWERQRQANRLRNLLREYYPAALAACPRLSAPEAVLLIERAPTPEAGRRLTVRQITQLLRHAGRQRGVAERAQAIQAALRTVHLEQPAALSAAYGTAAAALCRLMAALSTEIAALEQQLAAQFRAHPDAELLLTLPGIKAILGARVLAEFGDDPTRYADSKARKAAAGTAPVTRASGFTRSVRRRTTANRWLVRPCLHWADCSRRTSPGAACYYQALRTRGKTHNQALRALANRWVGILHGCLRYRTPYDEGTAWPALVAVLDAAEPATTSTQFLKTTGSGRGSSPSLAASP